MTDLAADLASRLANRALRDETWARESLARHAGRTFRVTVGPLSARLGIGPEGALEGVETAVGHPDLELVLSPFDVPALMADPTRWSRLVMATGDAALAATLQDLAQTLPWFVERAFARVLGPAAGQRAADAGRALLAFPAYASGRLAESVGSYARDEADLLAPGAEVRAFGEQVAIVAARVDALADRVARAQQAVESRGPRPVD